MKKVIHLEKIKLKCDACAWEYEKPITLSREWIDMPCPKCGANLLTEGDYEAGERLINLANMVNRILGPLFGKERMPEGEKLVRINPREHKTTIHHD